MCIIFGICFRLATIMTFKVILLIILFIFLLYFCFIYQKATESEQNMYNYLKMSLTIMNGKIVNKIIRQNSKKDQNMIKSTRFSSHGCISRKIHNYNCRYRDNIWNKKFLIKKYVFKCLYYFFLNLKMIYSFSYYIYCYLSVLVCNLLYQLTHVLLNVYVYSHWPKNLTQTGLIYFCKRTMMLEF